MRMTESDSSMGMGTMLFFNIPLDSPFAKAVFLHIRNQFRSWAYDDSLGSWNKVKADTALTQYKRAMLYLVLALATGRIEREGMLKSLKLLHLYDLYLHLEKIKDGATQKVPEKIRDDIRDYMEMVYPIEKRLIWGMDQKGFVAEDGRLRDGPQLLEWILGNSLLMFVEKPKEFDDA
jgi:hypothetical protein